MELKLDNKRRYKKDKKCSFKLCFNQRYTCFFDFLNYFSGKFNNNMETNLSQSRNETLNLLRDCELLFFFVFGPSTRTWISHYETGCKQETSRNFKKLLFYFSDSFNDVDGEKVLFLKKLFWTTGGLWNTFFLSSKFSI